MTIAEETLTWDIDVSVGGAQRPSLAQLGGATVEDDGEFPPDPASMPYAAQLNQWAKQIAAMGKVLPVAIISIAFSAGTPAVVGVIAPGTNIVPSSFTLVDNGVGDVSITWPVGSLPVASGVQPMGASNSASTSITVNTVAITNGVHVLVKNSASGAAVDLPFTVSIF